METEIVRGVFPIGCQSEFLEDALCALANTPPDECRTVYDLQANEIVAIANPPAFHFHDASDPTTIMSSDEILSHVVKDDIRTRVVGLKRSAQMKTGDFNRYSVHYYFDQVGLLRLDFESQPVLAIRGQTVLTVSRIRFVKEA